MSSVSIAEYRKLFPIKKNKKRRSAKQVARQPIKRVMTAIRDHESIYGGGESHAN
ncbi:hypothetical protein [Acinetobacter baumannii]|uniref:hypothetical protein n=1 Tax=Acinetobacter baumannii TaxID=470 RepID=UPI00148EEE0E|nr:hypothetical protein [Acinetobacter baumannii]